MDSEKQPSVAIIGAGPGGLASALLLAKSGVKVTVFERSQRVGGRNKVFEKDGFKYDLGPTFFHYPEVIEDIFQAIGLDAHEELKLKKLDINYRLIFGQGGMLDCTSNTEQMVERIAELSGRKNAEGFRKYLEDNKMKLDKSKQCLQEPWFGVTDLLSKRAMRVAGVLRPQRSVAKDLMKIFDDDRLMLAMSFQTKYLGMSPFNCPSLFTMLAFLEYEYGIFHPMGGLGSVSERMGEIAKDLGVEFRMGEAVTEVIMDKKTIKGVVTENGEFYADKVVMNADFAQGMTSLFPDKVRKKWSNKKIDNKKYSCSTFMLYLGVDRTYDDLDAIDKILAHHLIEICEPIDEEEAEIIRLACDFDAFNPFREEVERKNWGITSEILERCWDKGLQLRTYAEKIKIELSTDTEVSYNLNELNDIFDSVQVSISRTTFDLLIQPLNSKIHDLLDTLLQRSACEKSTITTVLLTGKSSYIPKIQTSIEDYFKDISSQPIFVFPKKNSNTGFHPKHCVSNGAAIWKVFNGHDTFRIYEKDICPIFTYRHGMNMKPIFSSDDKVENQNIYRKTITLPRPNDNFNVYENNRLFHKFTFEQKISSFEILFDKPNLYIEINGKPIYTNR